MKYMIETITPEMAQEYLLKNKVNRKISPGRVIQYANDIKSGKWQVNGESIKFFVDGSLCDGQHRLSGVIKANMPITTLVIRDIPNEVTIQDRGRTRNVTDALILEGIDRSLANNSIVAVAKLNYSLQKNWTNISDGMVKDFIIKNKDNLIEILNVVPKTTKVSKSVNVRCAPILLACLYAYKSNEVSIETIKMFLEVTYSGIPTSLDQTSAIILRNDIISGAVAIGGASTARIRATKQVEKALYDFNTQYPRKVTYANWNGAGIYSNHINNKEV